MMFYSGALQGTVLHENILKKICHPDIGVTMLQVGCLLNKDIDGSTSEARLFLSSQQATSLDYSEDTDFPPPHSANSP